MNPSTTTGSGSLHSRMTSHPEGEPGDRHAGTTGEESRSPLPNHTACGPDPDAVEFEIVRATTRLTIDVTRRTASKLMRKLCGVEAR